MEFSGVSPGVVTREQFGEILVVVFVIDTVPKSVSVPVKKEHSLKTLLVLQITITNNKIQRLCYYQRNS
ncbi:MAG: hypothetical protein PHC38_13160, partial [Weeksellaceae bacterium]|nr:hypothetical protein [Weeksellaceae bacterium]